VSKRRKITVLMTGLAGVALPLRPLSGVGVPEGRFLVDAVVRNAPSIVSIERPVPWWDLAERLRWTIALFERLERQERARP